MVPFLLQPGSKTQTTRGLFQPLKCFFALTREPGRHQQREQRR
jgi:hypothetical protein